MTAGPGFAPGRRALETVKVNLLSALTEIPVIVVAVVVAPPPPAIVRVIEILWLIQNGANFNPSGYCLLVISVKRSGVTPAFAATG